MYSAKKNETRDLIALAQYEYSIWPSCHNQIILSSIQYYHFIPQKSPFDNIPHKNIGNHDEHLLHEYITHGDAIQRNFFSHYRVFYS